MFTLQDPWLARLRNEVEESLSGIKKMIPYDNSYNTKNEECQNATTYQILVKLSSF